VFALSGPQEVLHKIILQFCVGLPLTATKQSPPFSTILGAIEVCVPAASNNAVRLRPNRNHMRERIVARKGAPLTQADLIRNYLLLRLHSNAQQKS
jgi:hypothetical protein